MPLASRFWSYLTASPEVPRSRLAVIGWWERRRLAYNLLVGSVGLAGFLVFAAITSRPGAIPPGEDAFEPITLFVAPLAINLAYTAGWVAELLTYRRSRHHPLAPLLMRLGLGFSLLLLLAPPLAWVGILLTGG